MHAASRKQVQGQPAGHEVVGGLDPLRDPVSGAEIFERDVRSGVHVPSTRDLTGDERQNQIVGEPVYERVTEPRVGRSPTC
jgi:hypothetical protein